LAFNTFLVARMFIGSIIALSISLSILAILIGAIIAQRIKMNRRAKIEQAVVGTPVVTGGQGPRGNVHTL
jgi:putative Ca2+/H+ antiporter (TMEM165/GDT1 family)